MSRRAWCWKPLRALRSEDKGQAGSRPGLDAGRPLHGAGWRTSGRALVLQVDRAVTRQYARIAVDEAAGPEFRLACRTAPQQTCRVPGQHALSGRWLVPDVRYLHRMINGVPIVITPAEIDVTTAGELGAVLGRQPAAGIRWS